VVLPDGCTRKVQLPPPHHRHSKGDRITEPRVASTRRLAVTRFTGVATYLAGISNGDALDSATSGRKRGRGKVIGRPTHRHGANGRGGVQSYVVAALLCPVLLTMLPPA